MDKKRIEKQALSQTNLIEGGRFLELLVKEINAQHGSNLDLLEAGRLVKTKIDQLNVSREMREQLLAIAEMVEASFDNRIANGVFFPFACSVFGLHHHSKKKQMNVNEQELVLPDRLAAGFVCAFAGALLCVVPGGQGVGLTLIGTGLSIAIEGMVEGEKPYFIDRAEK